jgi:very-short-patch-repair endonuclease
MPGTPGAREDLGATLRAQDGVIARQQAFACGLTRDALAHRARTGGPWRRILPHVYIAHTGAASAEQKDMAALLYAGPGSIITGRAALRALGVSASAPRRIDVLVPASRRPHSVDFVTIHRTKRMPGQFIDGRRSYALVYRALADAARGLSDLGEVRALIAGAVQRRACPLPMLTDELWLGETRGSARLRQVLDEVGDGVRSAAEAEFRDLIRRARLPMPMFNARLLRADGSFLAVADAWWAEAGVVVEVDSREWHLRPADWERTMSRHDDMISQGILVLHFSPRQIRTDPATVVTKIADALAAGRARPPLPVSARPSI